MNIFGVRFGPQASSNQSSMMGHLSQDGFHMLAVLEEEKDTDSQEAPTPVKPTGMITAVGQYRGE